MKRKHRLGIRRRQEQLHREQLEHIASPEAAALASFSMQLCVDVVDLLKSHTAYHTRERIPPGLILVSQLVSLSALRQVLESNPLLREVLNPARLPVIRETIGEVAKRLTVDNPSR